MGAFITSELPWILLAILVLYGVFYVIDRALRPGRPAASSRDARLPAGALLQALERRK